jgi:hypothetical protein
VLVLDTMTGFGYATNGPRCHGNARGGPRKYHLHEEHVRRAMLWGRAKLYAYKCYTLPRVLPRAPSSVHTHARASLLTPALGASRDSQGFTRPPPHPRSWSSRISQGSSSPSRVSLPFLRGVLRVRILAL